MTANETNTRPEREDIHETLGESFESAWQSQQPPSLGDYLKGESSSRLHCLLLLLPIDQYHRWGTSQRMLLEDYRQEYEELQVADESAILELICEELSIRIMFRVHRTESQYILEYQRRFPALADRIVDYVGKAWREHCWGMPRIAGHEMIGKLGNGSYGTVYLTRHIGLNRLTAIKHLASQVDAEVLTRFKTEGRIAADHDHENLIRVYDSGWHEGKPYIVMEYIDGGSLRTCFQRSVVPIGRNRLDANGIRTMLQTMSMVATGVQQLHSHNIIHRDLKPENVLLTEAGTPKVADFGLVKRLSPATVVTTANEFLGTLEYASPEQVEGNSLESTSDVWALGVILFEGLRGRRPFEADEQKSLGRKICTQEPPRLLLKRERAWLDLEAVVFKCLEKQPNRRYPNAGALAEELGRILAGEPTLVRPAGTMKRARRWSYRHRVWLLSLLAFITLPAGIVGIWQYDIRKNRDQHNQNQTEVLSQLGERSAASWWTPQRLANEAQSTQALLERLSALQPDANMEQELKRRIAEAIASSLCQEVLKADTREQIIPYESCADLVRLHHPAAYAQYQDALAVNFRQKWHAIAALENLRVLKDSLGQTKSLIAADNPNDLGIRQESKNPFVSLLPLTPQQIRIETDWDLSLVQSRQAGFILDARGWDPQPISLGGMARGEQLWVGYEGSARIWNLLNYQPLMGYPLSGKREAKCRYTVTHDSLLEVDGQQVRARSSAGIQQYEWSLPSPVEVVAATPRYLVTSRKVPLGSQIELWRIPLPQSKPERAAGWTWEGATAMTLAVASDGASVAAANGDSFRIWSSRSDKSMLKVIGADAIRSLVFSEDGQFLFLNGHAGVFRFQVSTGKIVEELAHKGRFASSMALAPGGMIVLGGDDGVAQRGGDGWRILPADHPSSVTAVGFAGTPQSPVLVTAGIEGSINIWDRQIRHVIHRCNSDGELLVIRATSASLGQVSTQGGSAAIEYWNDGILLSSKMCVIPAGNSSLHLSVERIGNQLDFRISRDGVELGRLLHRNLFSDPVGSMGQFAMLWPRGATLRDCRASFIKENPERPFQQADSLYLSGKHPEAYRIYNDLMSAPTSSQSQEAKYKRSLCDYALGRPDSGRKLMRELVDKLEPGGEPWPLLALFRLWLDDAARSPAAGVQWYDMLKAGRFPRAVVQEIIPWQWRAELTDRYTLVGSKEDFTFLPSRTTDTLESASEILDFLGGMPNERLALDQRLLEGYWLRGDDDRADALLARMLLMVRTLSISAFKEGVYSLSISRNAWRGRVQRRDDSGRQIVDQFLSLPELSNPENSRIRQRLLLERARCSAAASKWRDVEQDLRSTFAVVSKDNTEYELYFTAQMLQGFAREQAGDADGAKRAWGAATLRGWCLGVENRKEIKDASMSVEDRLKSLMAETLGGTLREADIENLRNDMVTRQTANLGVFERRVLLPMLMKFMLQPKDYLSLAKSEKARILIRHHVLQDVPFRQLYIEPAAFIASGTFLGLITKDSLSREEVEVIEAITTQSLNAFLLGKISTTDVKHCLMFGIGMEKDDPTAKLAEEVRPGIAFVLGLLLEHPKSGLVNMKQAEEMYKVVLQHERNNQAIKRFAQERLKRIQDIFK